MSRTTEEIKEALHLNERLSYRFHSKYPSISRDEFVSQGLVGIARANKVFVKGNWMGYVKIAIQNEMLYLVRQEIKKQKFYQKAFEICNRNHYILYEEAPETFLVPSNTRYRDWKTGKFISKKAHIKQHKEHYENVKRKNGNIRSK